ncbi:hypothetical protein HPB51_007085 [Rhipicephalus microplus]|uniref:CCHC-type domain-containing protein n=1 Tax=Rhipicephalus microplus TaxID=6941 RepID=A0A9J6DZ56_RHIMP|nr:hypothetical protein HPB51_007085 [Rhipicephalus microplus]
MSRDTNTVSSGGRRGGERGCFKCGEESHITRDSPTASCNNRPKRGSVNCEWDTQMSRDYLNPEQEWCFKGCFNCGEEGHKSGECPNPDDGGRQGRDCSEDKGYQSR